MSEKGKKVLNIFKRIGIGLSIGFNVLFLVAIIIGSSGIKKQNNNVNVALAEFDNQVSDKIEFKNDNKKFVSYDDSNYRIIISSDELNNNSFENFNNFLLDNDAFYDNAISFLYDGNDFNIDDYSSGAPFFYFTLIEDGVPNNTISFNYSDDFKFTYYMSNDRLDFTTGITIVLESEYYYGAKEAIQEDLYNPPITTSIFETLTDSVVAFVGSLSSGIVAMTSVFYDSVNGQLTTIGLLSVIVVAVSLAYFLFRLIIGLIRMRG